MSDLDPTGIANQALDASGVTFTLGDIQEGTREAQVCLRAYRNILRRALREVNWDFARAQAPLLMLADATGQTPTVGSIVPSGFTYEYAYPTDCVKARFVIWNLLNSGVAIPPGNIQISTAPQNTGNTASNQWQPLRPARFLIATDNNYPVANNDSWEIQGVSPEGRTVILTNVNQAVMVYTRLMLYPSTWDPNFRDAMVAWMAAEIALPLASDKKFGMLMRRENMLVLKKKLDEARVANGNENGYNNTDHYPDWMASRLRGRYDSGSMGGDSVSGSGGGVNFGYGGFGIGTPGAGDGSF